MNRLRLTWAPVYSIGLFRTSPIAHGLCRKVLPSAPVASPLSTRWTSTGASSSRIPLLPYNTGILVARPKQTFSRIQILRKLRRLARHKIRADEQPNAIILISKAFASWLSPNESFLKQAVTSLFEPERPPPPEASPDVTQTITVFSAVVDRLPDPSKATDGSIQHVCEGIAVCVSVKLPLLAEIPLDSEPHSAALSSRAMNYVTDPNQMPALNLKLFDYLDENLNPLSNTSFKLPLANTLFQTGQQSTVSISQWTRSSNGLDLAALHQGNSKLYSLLLPSGCAVQPARTGPRASLSVPLEAFVAPRSITDSMGNVITKVLGDDGTAIPASQELEKAVADHIVRKGLAPQTMSVWALVIPKSLIMDDPKLLEGFSWMSEMTESPASPEDAKTVGTAIFSLLKKGATLRRVLSGGGGWGNKAGLLSIDPDTDFAEKPLDDFAKFLANPAGDQNALKDVALPGDLVSFLVLNQPPQALESNDSSPSLSPAQIPELSVVFGVAPSTLDDVHTSKPARQDPKGRSRLFTGCFGFLSEGGMSFSQTSAPGSISVQSKIDVPLSVYRHEIPASRKAKTPSPRRLPSTVRIHKIPSTAPIVRKYLDGGGPVRVRKFGARHRGPTASDD